VIDADRRTTGIIIVLVALIAFRTHAAPVGDKGEVKLDSLPTARFHFAGEIGRRIKANVDHWLIVTPRKNPGLLDMFADREANVEGGNVDDSHSLVPWAGEFVGKYLISAAEAMRMSDDPKLRETTAGVVDRILQLQANDGYLGVWPKKEQLLAHWDLWSNYHIILGLLLWHESTGDQRAMKAACHAADLICTTFLDSGRPVHSAGAEEMNMGVIHGMAILHRKTGNPRYLEMANLVLKDFETTGDYYRQGLNGREFFMTSKPRWESLHGLQGLAELYRITGKESYRRAFLHHWASMRRFDLRNCGGFSSGEKATGNPFAQSAIETCCVIAWETIMIDALRLTRDATIADDLELTTFNAVAGAQHPSGDWFTYSTPTNGTRSPSFQQIAFQARPSTPYLNCCSVNGPRGFGMLSEWAVMRSGAGLAVNYFGPMSANLTLSDGTAVAISQATTYPVGDTVRLKVSMPTEKYFPLLLRVPAWSNRTTVSVNGQPMQGVTPGRYLSLVRSWKNGDEIAIRLDMRLRYESGDLEQAGKAAIYRGPLLLCADERLRANDSIAVDVSKLDRARVVAIDAATAKTMGPYPPWIVVDLPAAAGKTLRLVDFASAGSAGTNYWSWLPSLNSRPPRPAAFGPADNAVLGVGDVRFSWRNPAASQAAERRHEVLISDSPDCERIVIKYGDQRGGSLILPVDEVKKLQPRKLYYWKIVAKNENGKSESIRPYKRFTIDPQMPPAREGIARRSDAMVTTVPLRGKVEPEYGALLQAAGWKPAAGPDGRPDQAVELDGARGSLKYKLAEFPSGDCTVATWVFLTEKPRNGNGQIFSAWRRAMDDPLRLVVCEGKLFGRIEADAAYTTNGLPIETGRWFHAAAVKKNDTLTVWIDGNPKASTKAPEGVYSTADSFAIGGNPNLPGEECLAARFADFRLYARALSADELGKIFRAKASAKAGK
jgi:uncharacterized protein